METLHEFDERIGSFQTDSVPYEPVFALPPSLEEKVAPRSGSLRPFHGDTVAYFLDDRVRDLVGSIASDLHARFGESLSEPLPVEMAHVTLHDLHASPDRDQVRPLVEASSARASALVARARGIGPSARGTAVFNMMNTSAVIGVRAVDEEDHRKLLMARGLFDEVVPSGPFTPHITVAYYRPAMPVPLPPGEFRDALARLTGRVTGFPVALAPERLHTLRFDSMGGYWAVQH